MEASKTWERSGAGKRTAVREMFSAIAPGYDRLNTVMSLSRHHAWRRAAVETLRLQPGDRAIDVASGTGDFLPLLREKVGPKGCVIGSDFCLPMLERARPKSDAELTLADACALPFRTETFDGYTIGWGMRNVPDVDAAHREAFRVLKSGGRFVSLDMAQPRNALVRAASRSLFRTIVPLLGRFFGAAEAYAYLPESTERFHSREALAESMRRAGFEEVAWQDLHLGNLCLHTGRKP